MYKENEHLVLFSKHANTKLCNAAFTPNVIPMAEVANFKVKSMIQMRSEFLQRGGQAAARFDQHDANLQRGDGFNI